MEKIPSQQQNTTSQPPLYTENGVYMTSLQHNGTHYALGSTTPRYVQELSSMPLEPSVEDFAALRAKGVWLAAQEEQCCKVAVTCGGVGSVWPGMGRALYDTFPAAREAMDRLAALASWDILGLMDEKDMEKIGQTRWQMPYLFFVEYAQAAYLQSLGFSPCLMSGHSLGEIISLCLAGVYSPEYAWQIFDRRAVYIDGLEREAKDGMGMMAVYGSYEKVQNILELFPDLHICNHNTPTQFMLGGKKEMLAEAKRILRKDKCPALTLPINMAFHHPHLRVLRQSAVDGLMGLPAMAPQIPVLSNVTAGLYPTDKEGIVQYIADLDENTVRWVDCVRTMWDTFDIRHFVEFGSADNICGLVKEIEPRAVCIPVSLKNDEVQTMRAAVAHLYTLGHIPVKNLHVVGQNDFATGGATEGATGGATQEHSQPLDEDSKTQAPAMPAYVQDILPIIAEAAGVQESVLRPHMDLRHELALRSNRFPSIMLKIEQLFGITLRLEDVLHVATIQDFAQVVARLRKVDVQELPVESSVQEGAQQITESVAPSLAPLMCMRGAFTQDRTALQWRRMPWPSTLIQEREKQTLLVIYAGKGQELFSALEGLAFSGCHIIFYAPALSIAQGPSEAVLQRLQAMGATVQVHTDPNFLQGLHVHAFVHLVEGAVVHELTSPVAIPILRALEQSSFHVQSVITVVADRGEGAAFGTEPALDAMYAFWQHFAQKHTRSKPTIRVLRIPPVLSLAALGQENGQVHGCAQDGISPAELAQYFSRWFWCADVEQGRWVRDGQGQPCVQENLIAHTLLYPVKYHVQATEESCAEQVLCQYNFSAYGSHLGAHKHNKHVQEALPRAPQLTLRDFLHALYAGAHMSFPWLHCEGVDAFTYMPQAMSVVSEGPEGVTREGRIAMQNTLLLSVEQQSGQNVGQKCLVELSLRGLSANGRAQDIWHRAATGHMIFAPNMALPLPLGIKENAQESQSYQESAMSAKHIFVGKKFAKKGALQYAWVSELVELLQEAVQNVYGRSRALCIGSIAQLRHAGDEVFVGEDALCVLPLDSVTICWRVLQENTQGIHLDAEILCAKGSVLLTAQEIVFVTEQ